MGGEQSSLIRSESDASEDGACQPCFLFKAPFSRSNDAIGSPMPETPLDQRRQQKAVKNALRKANRNNPVFSSKYLGLEKEVVAQSEGAKRVAEIHEGKVCIP